MGFLPDLSIIVDFIYFIPIITVVPSLEVATPKGVAKAFSGGREGAVIIGYAIFS